MLKVIKHFSSCYLFYSILIFLFYVNLQTYAQPIWIHDYRGIIEPTNNDAYAITIDNIGNAYITGMSDPHPTLECTTNTYIATVKINSDGSNGWVNRYSGCGGGWGDSDAGNSIATITKDDRFYIYVSGRTSNNGSMDFVTIQYDENGIIIWVQTYSGSGNGNDEAIHIDVDEAGNAYITGYCNNLNNGIYSTDYVTIKYDFDGNEEWVRTYNGSANMDDIPKSLDYSGGYIYVTGKSFGIGTGEDIVTIAYGSNGDLMWIARYDDGGSNEIGNDISADPYRGVYVTGSSGANKFTTIKYENVQGSQLWVKNDEIGGGNSIGLFRKPCVGDVPCYTIDVFVTGGSSSNAITIGYDEDGNLLNDWPVINYACNTFISIGVDGSENIYVTGSSGNNYYIVKYDYTGLLIWSDLYQHSGSFAHISRNIKVDLNGNAYVSGSVYFNSTANRAYYTTIKYAP